MREEKSMYQTTQDRTPDWQVKLDYLKAREELLEEWKTTGVTTTRINYLKKEIRELKKELFPSSSSSTTVK